MFGEIIAGGHHQLTQGMHDEGKLLQFSFDFDLWKIEPYNQQALEHVKKIVSYLHIPTKKEKVAQELGATFSHDYLKGYFETVTSENFGLWFIDYNRLLGNLFGVELGKTVYPGIVEGKVRYVTDQNLDGAFSEGDILVCENTTPEYLSLMKKAGAIVTAQGGILSHAAIVARELKKPCIIGFDIRTLSEGERVIVDAKQGVVTPKNI